MVDLPAGRSTQLSTPIATNASIIVDAIIKFAGLGASRGADVAVAVKAFVERVEALESGGSPFGDEGVAARALLGARGLTAERIADAKATGAGLARLVVDTGSVSTAELGSAEKRCGAGTGSGA